MNNTVITVEEKKHHEAAMNIIRDVAREDIIQQLPRHLRIAIQDLLKAAKLNGWWANIELHEMPIYIKHNEHYLKVTGGWIMFPGDYAPYTVVSTTTGPITVRANKCEPATKYEYEQYRTKQVRENVPMPA